MRVHIDRDLNALVEACRPCLMAAEAVHGLLIAAGQAAPARRPEGQDLNAGSRARSKGCRLETALTHC